MGSVPDLRGNYAEAAADYSVEQRWERYTPEEHALYRRPFELERVMRTDYQIDRYQDTYFVIDSFAHLMGETAVDFTPIYAHIRSTL